MSLVDVRCSRNPSRLFLRIKEEGVKPRFVDEGRLLEIACRDCVRELRKEDPAVKQVYHLFNVVGELVEDRVERSRPVPITQQSV
jgi:hypothetical protein